MQDGLAFARLRFLPGYPARGFYPVTVSARLRFLPGYGCSAPLLYPVVQICPVARLRSHARLLLHCLIVLICPATRLEVSTRLVPMHMDSVLCVGYGFCPATRLEVSARLRFLPGYGFYPVSAHAHGFCLVRSFARLPGLARLPGYEQSHHYPAA